MDFALSRLGYCGSRKVRARLCRGPFPNEVGTSSWTLHEESGGCFDPE